MSNIVAIDTTNLPAYLKTVALADNADMMNGLFAGAPPTIALNGTRFVVKENGEENTLNQLELQVVLLKAKPNLDKTWYAAKFTPGQEPSAPDCFSTNGMTPDSSATLPQCASCAGCPQNQFGSGTDAQGNATKGKACTDSKIVAIFANGNTYKFKIPPASLKNFAGYIRLLSSNQLPVDAVITKIGFDAAFSYPVLTFAYGGVLAEAQYRAVQEKKASAEVADIIGGTFTPQKPALVAPAPAPAPVVEEAQPDLGLVVEEAPVVKEAKKPAPKKPTPAPAPAPAEDDLAAALGL